MQGIYEIKLGNLEEGVEMVWKAISIYNDLGSRKLADTTESFLNIILDERKSKFEK